jgi:hypothetical protein
MKTLYLIIRLIVLLSLCSFIKLDIQAQPIYQSSITNIGSASNATVNRPSGVVLNELLVIGLMFEKGSSEAISTPSGWTLIRRTDNGTDCGMVTYYKIATASEPSSYSFGLANGSKWAIGITRISNAYAPLPIDASAESSGFGSAVSAPSITTTGGNKLLLSFYTNKKDATFSHADGARKSYDHPNNAGGLPSNMMAHYEQVIAGATGSKVATASESERWAAQQIAISSDNVLPVKLIDFKATICDNFTVCLSWKTASERNNDYFSIERAKDAYSWEKIGEVAGAENSSAIIQYNTQDNTPYPGINYYRLKQTDIDGKGEYSNCLAIQVVETELRAYPNPTTDFIILSGHNGTTVALFDVMGKEIDVPKEELPTSIVFDLSSLEKGAYLIKTETSLKRIYKY